MFAAEAGNGGTVVTGGIKSGAEVNEEVVPRTYLVTFYASDRCDPTGFGQGADLVGRTIVQTAGANDPNGIPPGEALIVANVPAVLDGRFVTATATDVTAAAPTRGDTSEFSNCAVAGPDNTVWKKAQPLDASHPSANGYIEASDKSRWYRFPITPNGRVKVDVTGPNGGQLPENYDVVFFSDIQKKYDEQTGTGQTLSSLTEQSAETPNDAVNSSQFSSTALEPTTIDPSLNKPQSAGSAYFGSAYFGSAYFGSAYFGSAYFGSAYFGSAYFGSAYFGSAYFGSAYFGSAYFGSAYFGSAYFGSAYFDPAAFSSAQTTSVIGLSANAGTVNEDATVNTWNNTGNMYVRVLGPGGARSSVPFTITVTAEPSACTGVATAPTVPAYATDGVGKDYRTLILTDTSRPGLAGGAATVTASLIRLQTKLASRGLKAKIVDLATDAYVANRNQVAGAHPGCVFAKNLVAEAAKRVVTAYRKDNPNLKYVVLAGGDNVIPFFRTPDRTQIGHESSYFPPVEDSSTSQANLRLGYVLSQDAYGAATVLEIKGAQIPMPNLAVGRLVETPTQIQGMIDAFVDPAGETTQDGALKPVSSLVTGYDFVQDGADDVAKTLKDGMFDENAPNAPIRNDELISNAGVNPAATQPGASDPWPRGKSWAASDLKSRLLGTTRHDLVYLAGHFSGNDALAADYTTVLTTTELEESSTDFKNSIVFSVGCHSGYNIVDEHGVAGVTQTLDWAQAFAQKQATLVAGTGYQYGDTDFIEYSERLYAEFARQLRVGTGPVSVGDALVRAKQLYLQQSPSLGTLDEKTMLEATIFGLPMTSVDMPNKVLETLASSDIQSSQKVDTADSPGQTLGLIQADVTLDDVPTRNVTPAPPDPKALMNSDGTAGPRATWWEAPNGDVLAAPAQPVLPLLTRNVSIFGRLVGGMTTSSTSLTLDASSGAKFPAPPFTAQIGAERVLVNGVSGDTFTITRAQGGTAAAPHTTGDVVSLAAVVRGVGFRGGTYTDYPGVTPLTGAPGTELRGVHVPFTSDVFFPLRTGIVNYFGAYSDGGAANEQLKVTPAQYRSTVGDPRTNTARVFGTSSFRVFYSGNTSRYCTAAAPCANGQPTVTPALAEAPGIGPVSSSTDGSVKAPVYGDPRAGVQSVWITYTVPPSQPGTRAEWKSIDLDQDAKDKTLWRTPSNPRPDQLMPAGAVFMVQAVNGVGLISRDDNRGAYYNLGTQAQGTVATATKITTLTAPADGRYSSSIAVSAKLTDVNGAVLSGVPRPVVFTLGATSVVAYTAPDGVASTNLLVTAAPGAYDLVASFGGEAAYSQSAASRPFTSKLMPTTVTLAADSPPATQDPSGTWKVEALVGDGTPVYSTVLTDPNGDGNSVPDGAPVTERSVLFVAYTHDPTTNALVPAGALVARTNWRGRANLGSLQVSPGSYVIRAFFGELWPQQGGIGPFDLRDVGYDGSHTTADTDLVVLDIASTLQLTKTASISGGKAKVTTTSDVVTYTYTLKNTGNVTLVGPSGGAFSISDDKINGGTRFVCSFGSLAPQATKVCTATHTITQADLDAGSVTNTATAYGEYEGAEVPSNHDSVTVSATQTTGLTLGGSVSPTTYTAPGTGLTFTFAATNSGNVTLSSPSIPDASCPSAATLAPGATFTCTVTTPTTQADVDAGSVSQTRTATASFGSPVQTVSSAAVTRTATATRTPTLGLSASVSPSQFSTTGIQLTYTFVARNTGNVTLTNVTVPSTTSCSPSTLAPGAEASCTFSRTTTQADLDAGQAQESRVATASYGVTNVSASASAAALATQQKTLSLTVSVSPTTYSATGTSLVFSFLATNTGNVTLLSPTVSGATCPTVTQLAPGGTLTCTVTRSTTQADLDAGTVTVSKTATATFSGATVSSAAASATAAATQTRALAVTITPTPTSFGAAGQTITSTFTLKNTGNVTLSPPYGISGLKAGSTGTVTCGATTIAPTATVTCSGSSYVTTSADVSTGGVTLTAVASATLGTQTVNSTSASKVVPYIAPATRFPSTALAKNNYVWFNAVGKFNRTSSQATFTIGAGSIKLNLTGGKTLNLTVPSTIVTYASVAFATTTVDTSGRWIVTVPTGYSGPVFIGGLSYKTSQDVTIQSGTWTLGSISATGGCLASWKWAAAGYSGNFGPNGSSLKVKPIDGGQYWDATGDPDSAFDFAATPDGPTASGGSTRYRYSVLPWYTLDTGNGGAPAPYLGTFYNNDGRTPTGYYGGPLVSSTCQ